MASTTTNLGLTKPAYSDDADISDINGNMDLIDAEAGKVRANVAANYDSSETYAVGDYCLHDGSLYKCTTAISSPESWTAGHWTQIKIAGELSSLSDHIATLETPTAIQNIGASGHESLIQMTRCGKIVQIIFNGLYYGIQWPSNLVPKANQYARFLIIGGSGAERYPVSGGYYNNSVAMYLHKNGGEDYISANGTISVYGVWTFIAT